MNFVISSATLLKHLQGISGVLSTSNTLPILDNFLFEIDSLQLTHTNWFVTHALIRKRMEVHRLSFPKSL